MLGLPAMYASILGAGPITSWAETRFSRSRKCERVAAAVPRELPIEGLSLAEYEALATESVHIRGNNIMKTVLDMLDGYKMYILSALLFLCVVVEKGFGWDIPGLTIGDNWMDYIFVSWGLAAHRSAMNKLEG